MKNVPDLIAALKSERTQERAEAAIALRDMKPPPVDAVPALIERLDDTDSFTEESCNWNMDPVYGDTHVVRERAVEALIRIGTPAFAPIVEKMERGGPQEMLRTFIEALPLDTLCAAGPSVIARARQLSSVASMDALVWASDEFARSEDRIDLLTRRLDFPAGSTAKLAVEELGRTFDYCHRAAAVLATFLLREKQPPVALQEAVAAALDNLGPVLNAALVSRLVEASQTPALAPCLKDLFPALGAYPAAASLGPQLLERVLDPEPPTTYRGEWDYADKVRKGAMIALARLGPAARPEYEKLVEMYAEGYPQAYVTLNCVADRRVLVEKHAKRWRRLLKSRDRRVVLDTLSLILELRGAAAPLFDAVLPFVEGPHAYWTATALMGQLGDIALPAVPALIRALNDPELAFYACVSLGELGPKVGRHAIHAVEKFAAGDHATNPRANAATDMIDAALARLGR